MSINNINTLQRRVRRGAALLRKEFGPLWYKRVDVNNLRMQSAASCVLGCMFRNPVKDGYWVGLDKLSGFPQFDKRRSGWAEARGFYLTDGLADYGLLGDLWKEMFKREAERAKKLGPQPLKVWREPGVYRSTNAPDMNGMDDYTVTIQPDGKNAVCSCHGGPGYTLNTFSENFVPETF